MMLPKSVPSGLVKDSESIWVPDPAKAEGIDPEVMQVFRTVRDAIEEKVIKALKAQPQKAPKNG